jgi:hypothetical protein
MELALNAYRTHSSTSVDVRLMLLVGYLCDPGASAWSNGSYLVDPASSHMLVSKIKPCMSKYKLLIL